MANDVSKSAKWAKRLAVVTLVCAAVVGAAFLWPFEGHGDFSGLFRIMAVGLVTIVFGGIGVLCSIVGIAMTVSAIRTRQDWNTTTKFAATIYSLTAVTVVIVAILWRNHGR